MERLISAPGLHFKGTGWYVTDYAKSSSRGNGEHKASKDSGSKDSGNAESKSSDKSSGSESKSESKPAPTSKSEG